MKKWGTVPSTKYKVGIRVLTQIVLLKDLGALYLVPGTLYNVHFFVFSEKYYLNTHEKDWIL